MSALALDQKHQVADLINGDFKLSDYYKFELVGVKEHFDSETKSNRLSLCVGKEDAAYYVLIGFVFPSDDEQTLIQFDNDLTPEVIEEMLRMNEHINANLTCLY